jgi:hypothetical protein
MCESYKFLNSSTNVNCWILELKIYSEKTCLSTISPKDLVTGREIWLPTGNRVSRAPTVIGVTEQKISKLFELKLTTLYK